MNRQPAVIVDMDGTWRDGDFRSNADIKREIHSPLELTYEIRAAIDDDRWFSTGAKCFR